MSLSVLAQIDLFRILQRSGCSLMLHDQIFNWVVHWSQKTPVLLSGTTVTCNKRAVFLKKLTTLLDMKCHQPIIKTVESQFNHRKISVPVFSFVDQAVSLLTSDLLTPEYLIDGYAIFSGTRCQHFWNPASIDDSDTMSIPTQTDPKQKTSDIHSSYLFQSAVSRFCSKPNHIPVPVIIGYGKANLSRQGDLAVAPLIFTFGFYKSRWRHKSSF